MEDHNLTCAQTRGTVFTSGGEKRDFRQEAKFQKGSLTNEITAPWKLIIIIVNMFHNSTAICCCLYIKLLELLLPNHTMPLWKNKKRLNWGNQQTISPTKAFFLPRYMIKPKQNDKRINNATRDFPSTHDHPYNPYFQANANKW